MKPQKKSIIGRKATKTSVVAKKRSASLEKSAILEVKKEKCFKKLTKLGESRKKIVSELKKKKAVVEKKKEKSQKVEERKQKLVKESIEKLEKKCDRMIEKIIEEREDTDLSDSLDKKKIHKLDDKTKNDKQCTQEAKKQSDKIEEKDEKTKSINGIEDKINVENKIDDKISMLPVKKRIKEENKRREAKLMKLEIKDNSKIITVKDIKKPERKKSPEQEVSQKSSPIKTKKEVKIKQSLKKNSHKKTVFSTKKSHLPIVKKLFDKKSKLVKSAQVAETLSSSSSSLTNLDIIKDLKQDKKKPVSSKVKDMLVKKFNDEKSAKATIRLSQKNTKMNLLVKSEDKVKNGNLDKSSMKKSDFIKDLDTNFSEIKKSPKEESYVVHTDNIKKEIIDEQEIVDKIKEDSKKNLKSKISRKMIKKSFKNLKNSNDSDTDKNENTSDENIKQRSKSIENQSKDSIDLSVEGQDLLKVNLKVETINGESCESASTSESEDGDEDYARRNRSKTFAKIKERTPSEERVMTNRMKLFGFWSGPKRHRVASLNALAKVHCLYENENGGVYLGGFCKPKPEKEKEKDKENKPRKCKEEKEDKIQQKDKKCNKSKAEETSAKRKLRNVPGLRGKHYDVLEGLTSSSSSDEDLEMRREREKEKKKKEKEKERLERVKEKKLEEEKEKEKRKAEEGNEIEDAPIKKPKQKRRKKNAEIMDLKDMVVCKRMASLNASAILAASYSDEKNRLGTSSDSSSSSESDVEFIKRRRQSDSDIDKRKQRQGGSDVDDLVKPSKKVMIVNQDTDVTITGVYVNQTRSTHHEGFCSIAGMQYRICSTSHTQTAATAVATELHDQKEQPCKSYTPLGALSSMQPPGSQGNHSNMSPRRHSAFSAPHQHGYYQPAGPLIQHPPTLQSVKGPPPEPTPTPPQNSEGSDDLVATSTTSGGTSSTGGGFYRAYCPQYYATPPQYQDLCYSPSYSHSHPHPPPYYHKYAPPYRRQYYGYQESGPGSGPGGSGAGPGVVEYQPPPGEYLPYYGGYPPPPQPPPPPPNPAYLHSQGRPFVDHAFQSCPCPMQSCPKNADTGPLIGNGKGAPVISGPGLSLPPSALVGPPSPARGLAGLAPPHGANAWDTDRVQLSPAHRSHNQNQQQQQQQVQPALSQQAGHSSRVNMDCITKADAGRTEGKMHSSKYAYSQKQVANCSSGYDVKLEQNISPTNSMTDESKTAHTTSKVHDQQCHQHKKYHRNLKLENNNVKCELCNVEFQQKRIRIGKPATVSAIDEGQQRDLQLEHVTCASSCKIKCESGYKCEIFRCEQCMKEAGQLAIMEKNKNSGTLDDDAASSKLETDAEVKEELNTMQQIDLAQWNKADYEPTASEPVIKDDEITGVGSKEKEKEDNTNKYFKRYCNSKQQQQQRCEKVNRRKLSLDSLSDFAKLKKINKRTLSVGSARDFATCHQVLIAKTATPNSGNTVSIDEKEHIKESQNPSKKKLTKETSNLKRKVDNLSLLETPAKKLKITSIKTMASETSIMETINNVIQQSLQMSQKSTKTKKCKTGNNGKVEKKSKRSSINLLSTIKCASKKLDLVKAVVSEKLGLIRNEIKNSQQKINNKVDSKIKSKIQNVKAKNSKIKAKLFQVKSKVLESKNNNNKISEAKNTSNKISDVKNVKTAGAKNDNKIPESKNNINKVIETKNNKILETKNHKNKNQDGNDIKETKETKDIKSSVTTTSIFASNFVQTPFYVSELTSSAAINAKDAKASKFKGKLQEGIIEIKKSKKKGKNGKKLVRTESFCKIEEQIKDPFDKSLLIPRRPFLKPKWSNGWSWAGDAFEAKVYLTNEESAIRRCYVSMKHESGDILQPLDCVLLKSGPRKADLPFVAKIAALWENPDDGEMMFSLLWYYRPEHTEQGRAENDTDDEVFASRHRDANSVACIEDKCYILTFNEYCRYRKNLRRIEEGLDCPGLIVPPGDQVYPREIRQPPIPVPQDMVLFCRRVYDYRSKKLVKNPG